MSKETPVQSLTYCQVAIFLNEDSQTTGTFVLGQPSNKAETSFQELEQSTLQFAGSWLMDEILLDRAVGWLADRTVYDGADIKKRVQFLPGRSLYQA